MKKKIVLLFLFSSFLMLSMSRIVVVQAAYSVPTNSSVVLMESSSNRLLFSHDAYTRRKMASTTKILTAIVVIDHCNLEDVVTVPNAGSGVEGSSIYLRVGEKLTVRQLLYGLMLRSGNDCAVTLALHAAKTIEGFAQLMNNTVEKLGLKDSHFMNPHGLDHENHYTTAYDLAVISSYAMKNEVFREIVSTKKIAIPNDGYEYNRILINKNKMLHLIEGGNGIKTGYTKKAGRCLVSSCKRGNMEVICVVLNCGPMFELSTEYLEKMFSQYAMKQLLCDYQFVGEATPKNSDKAIKIYVKNGFCYPLTEKELSLINIRIEVDENALCENNEQSVGKIKIYYDKDLIFSEKLYTIVKIEDKDYWSDLNRVIDHYFLQIK